MDELFEKLIREQITPNSFYVLYSLSRKTKPVDIVNANLEITRLKNNGWLTSELEITDKSIIFIEEVNGYFRKSKKKSAQITMGTDFLTNIQNYNLLFPNRKLPSGSYARVNAKNLEAGFRWFFENYTYGWETILNATRMYVNEYSEKGFDYMRNSQYFVRKQAADKSFESTLANYCEMVNNDVQLESPRFKERYV
jgi:hypothetical protein